MNIGGFQVERPIARGGMGEVFEATSSLGHKVALKVVASERNADRSFVERFRREARAAAAIEHPNILPVYETGETEDGRLYMAMRLVRGGDLASRLGEEGPMTPTEALHLLGQIADALDAAHDHGIIHVTGVIASHGDSATSAAAIDASTEETRRVGELLVAYFGAAQEQGQAIRNCLTGVEEPDLSDISAPCVGARRHRCRRPGAGGVHRRLRHPARPARPPAGGRRVLAVVAYFSGERSLPLAFGAASWGWGSSWVAGALGTRGISVAGSRSP